MGTETTGISIEDKEGEGFFTCPASRLTLFEKGGLNMAAYDWSKGLVKGLFWGGLMGVVIGILYATKRDKGTWEDIGKSADALVDKTKEEMGQARREIEELANHGKDSYAVEEESLKKVSTPQG
jgi:hypothetical protein